LKQARPSQPAIFIEHTDESLPQQDEGGGDHDAVGSLEVIQMIHRLPPKDMAEVCQYVTQLESQRELPTDELAQAFQPRQASQMDNASREPPESAAY